MTSTRQADGTVRRRDFRTHSLRTIGAGLLLLAAAGAHAQTFPSRPFTIYVTTAAGGTYDLMARLLADRLRKRSEHSVLVENRPGANGTLALAAAAAAPADGHMLVFAGNQIQHLFVKDVGYDPARLTPVSLFSTSPYTVVASRASGLRDLRELLAWAKANPGRLTLGAVAGPHEIEVHGLVQVLGISANVIPYKGIAPIEAAVLAGELNGTLVGNLGRVKSGQVVALATGGEARNPDIAEVPTFRELGYDYDPRTGYAVWTRSETPPALLERLVKECQDLVRSPEYTAAVVHKLGLAPLGSSREFAIRYLSEEREKLRRVAERAGIRPQ
jgi:tripartite-type tricarboxylate transporter receptor subunit TctC